MGLQNCAHGSGYSLDEAHLAFEHGLVGKPAPDEFYWKIGITVRNLDHAVRFLRSKNISVPDPSQFQNIGYMTHIADPDGHTIELLQQSFEGNESDPGSGHPIGAQAILAHITLRVYDLDAAQTWTEKHGLRLMSVQPIAGRAFTLYFYSWSEEELPNADLEAVENREWLWARPYTILELQHLQSAAVAPQKSPQLVGLSVERKGNSMQLVIDDLNV